VLASCGGGGSGSPAIPQSDESPAWAPIPEELALFSLADLLLYDDLGGWPNRAYGIILYRSLDELGPDNKTLGSIGRSIDPTCAGTRYEAIGCIAGMIDGYNIRLWALPASHVDNYNATLDPDDRIDRCRFYSPILIGLYIHETLHAYGYKHGDAMADKEKELWSEYRRRYSGNMLAIASLPADGAECWANPVKWNISQISGTFRR
jgi:hypothetical protein